MNFKKAFTTEEVLVSLSLIAFLLILMISLNNVAGNNYKVATEKFSQVDTLLKRWSFTAKKNKIVINNQDTLVNSLLDYMNNNNTNKLKANRATKKEQQNYDEINLNNGVKLYVKYVKNIKNNTYTTPIYNIDRYNMNEPVIAVITAKTKAGHTDFTEEYIYKQTRLISLSNLYEGWDKYPVENITTKDGKTIKMYCAGYENCKKGCSEENSCEKTNSNGAYIYIKTIVSTPCREGHNGNIEKQQIGSIEGVYEITIDKCCPKPQTFIGGKTRCECSNNFQLTKGYIYNKDSLTCQTPCMKGTYLNKGKCKPCDKNHYCPDNAMTAPKKCPKNSCGTKAGIELQKDACTPCNK